MENRVVLSRHIACIENVLNPHWYAVKNTQRLVGELLQAIGFTGLVQRIGGIEKSPGANRILKLLDPSVGSCRAK
jgi:hypothetical protein